MSAKRVKLISLWKKALKDESLPLKSGATKLVFGAGNPDAKVLFIGEGPGYWEDQKGVPFVGRAGDLLNVMLERIDLKREDVFITNVVMYRPPGNRDPEEFEIKAFSPYLDGIIKIIKPEVISTLGRFSMAKFLPGVYISDVHGKRKEIKFLGKEIALFPMYHPAAALRNPVIKRKLEEDFDSMGDYLKKNESVKEDDVDMKGKDDNIKSEVDNQLKLI